MISSKARLMVLLLSFIFYDCAEQNSESHSLDDDINSQSKDNDINNKNTSSSVEQNNDQEIKQIPGSTTQDHHIMCSSQSQTPDLSQTPQVVEGFNLNDDFGFGFSIMEGPVWYQNALYISHIENGEKPQSRILKWTATQGVSVAAPDAGSNGLAVGPTGLLATRHRPSGAIVGLDSNLEVNEVLVSGYNGQAFNSPNDLILHRSGVLFFTDPNWQASTPNPQAEERVYKLQNNKVTALKGTPSKPNGITLSPDQKTLYTGGENGMVAYSLNSEGDIEGTGKAFADGLDSIDGMAVDCSGNIYITSKFNVSVYKPDNTKIGDITVPQQVTNVAFGGEDLKTLFITTLGTQPQVYQVNVGIEGSVY